MDDLRKIAEELPFTGYILSLDEEEAARLKRKLEYCGGFSESTTSRFLHGTIRPNMLVRREIASVIRRHSGNKEWTGDNLFPVAFYQKKN